MPASALTLALASAVLHAAWNLLLGRARELQAAAAVTFVLAEAIAIPFAVLRWHVEPAVWPYALASTFLELVYVVGLAYAYLRAEVSFVYPLTRGLAPVFALAFATVALGHGTSPAELGGVLLVGVGVVLVRGLGRRHDLLGIALVLTTAVAIAGYTLVDRAGLRYASALSYFVLIMVGPCLVYPLLVGWSSMWRAVDRTTLLAAGASFASFALGLVALRYAAAAPVLAVRSASVVIAAAFAGRLLAERVSSARLAGSSLVFAGIVLLAVA